MQYSSCMVKSADNVYFEGSVFATLNLSHPRDPIYIVPIGIPYWQTRGSVVGWFGFVVYDVSPSSVHRFRLYTIIDDVIGCYGRLTATLLDMCKAKHIDHCQRTK